MNIQTQYEICKYNQCLNHNVNRILVHKKTKNAHEKKEATFHSLSIQSNYIIKSNEE